jgi:hypothetical protein
LHVSPGGVQAPKAHAPLQDCVPVEPQVVEHVALAPAQQPKPSSHSVSQSSSRPLHVSTGGVHALQPHAAPHVWLPVEKQDVVQASVAPAQQA